jgi:hypothetical protein
MELALWRLICLDLGRERGPRNGDRVGIQLKGNWEKGVVKRLYAIISLLI